MRSPIRRPGRALLVLLAAGWMACVSLGGPSPPIRYWVLEALAGPPANGEVLLAVGVGPVRLPEHLDRPNITTRTGESQLVVSQTDQWAEPLAVGSQRVIGENLMVLSPGLKTIDFPWSGPTAPELQIAVSVSRFDARPGDKVRLLAAWVLSRVKDRTDLERGSAWIEEPVEGSDTSDVVAAMSRALERLSRDLAASIERARSSSAATGALSAEPEAAILAAWSAPSPPRSPSPPTSSR